MGLGEAGGAPGRDREGPGQHCRATESDTVSDRV